MRMSYREAPSLNECTRDINEDQAVRREGSASCGTASGIARAKATERKRKGPFRIDTSVRDESARARTLR